MIRGSYRFVYRGNGRRQDMTEYLHNNVPCRPNRLKAEPLPLYDIEKLDQRTDENHDCLAARGHACT